MNNFSKISDRELELVLNFDYILCNCKKVNNNLDIRHYKQVNSLDKDIIVIYNIYHNELVCLYENTFSSMIESSIDLLTPKIKNKKVLKVKKQLTKQKNRNRVNKPN